MLQECVKRRFCLLDSGADCHLIDKGLYSDLDLSGRPMRLELQMANGELEKLDNFSVEFGVRGLNERKVFTLENARVVPRLPDFSGNIPSAQDIARNSHLAGIEMLMVSGVAKVQVIVGIDCPSLHVFSEIRQDGESRLWTGKSPLGWVLHGRDLTATSNA